MTMSMPDLALLCAVPLHYEALFPMQSCNLRCQLLRLIDMLWWLILHAA